MQVEMVRAGGYTMVQLLKEVFDVAWRREDAPRMEGGHNHTYS